MSGSYKLCLALIAATSTLTATTVFAGAQAAQQTSTSATAHATPAKPVAARKQHDENHDDNRGERVFAENCSRCHTAPDGFSQSISGTVVRHMRERASLSAQDEKALLRFFNP